MMTYSTFNLSFTVSASGMKYFRRIRRKVFNILVENVSPFVIDEGFSNGGTEQKQETRPGQNKQCGLFEKE